VHTADRAADASALAAHLTQALALLQGLALAHPPSKALLGRPYAQGALLDLLLAARHAPAPTLPAAALDTLLCVLVDAPPALRAFEDAGGVRATARILRRAGTPRELRYARLPARPRRRHR
jgi:hypothetical protein